jgi:heavy metal translocating P-type ATPase
LTIPSDLYVLDNRNDSDYDLYMNTATVAEPASSSLSALQTLQQELREERREMRIGAALTAITLLGMITAIILTALAVPAWLIVTIYVITFAAGGIPASISALQELRHGKLDIDLLMVLAALAAAAVGQARDGAFLLFLFSLAGVLEEFAMGNTKRAVTSLMDLRPDTANVLRAGQLEIVNVEVLERGDTVIVRPGEHIPVDGDVISGESSADQSAITGESTPVDKSVGDAVFAGSLNQQGALTIQVTKTAQSSTLARMIELVTQAQEQRAPSQRFSDWFGQRYTIAVLVGSGLALLTFLLFGMPQQEAFYKAATLLVVASPCAIVISVPAAILSALAASARQGILFKGGAALEDFGNVSVMAFDKTGTLTTGKLKVTDVIPHSSWQGTRDDLLHLAGRIEQYSEHPIAKSIVQAAQADKLEPLGDVTAHPGFGVRVQGDTSYWVGNKRFAQTFTDVQDLQTEAQTLEQRGTTPVFIGRDNQLLGVIAIADTPRASALDALRDLKGRNIARLVMLTGDNHTVATNIAQHLGLDPADVHAELLPDEKVARIQDLLAQTEHGKVAFVGDGVNDAAALATSDVGIAMGSAGSDAAIEAADVALLSDDLRVLAKAHHLAQRANRIVRQNLIFAISIMAIMIVLTLFGNLPLPLGVIGHEGGTLLVVANGLRLLLPSLRWPKRSNLKPATI